MGAGIAAIILAAGYSSRMGTFKPLLPLGNTTVLERVVSLFQEAGVEDVRVVVGHRSAELYPLVERLHSRPVTNKHFHDGMFSSVTAGVASLETDIEAFFLLPVDIPLVKRCTVEALLQKHSMDRSRILYPCFFGKRGHPPLIPGCHRKGILAWHGGGGLKSYLSLHEADAACIEVADETILADMDTPEDYDRLHAMWEKREIPSVRECEALLYNVVQAGEHLLLHCHAVADLAGFLVERLNRAGCTLDPDLVRAAALLHDMAKGEEDHASAGERILRGMGYSAVADIVASHMDISVDDTCGLNGNEIIYLADKMVSGDRWVSVEDRFRNRLKSLAADANLLEAVACRYRNALRIRSRVEGVLGNSLSEVLKDFHAGKFEGR